jgi:hypothetical protein
MCPAVTEAGLAVTVTPLELLLTVIWMLVKADWPELPAHTALICHWPVTVGVQVTLHVPLDGVQLAGVLVNVALFGPTPLK